MTRTKKCIDCGKKINRKSKRCSSCHIKKNWLNIKYREIMCLKNQFGLKNPNYKHGLNSGIHYCIDGCGKIVSRGLSRCKSCARKYEFKKGLRQKFSFKGFHHTKKAKYAIRNAHVGKIFSEIHKKNISLNHADVNKDNNPNWRNGVSFLPYGSGWTSILKKQVRSRDGCVCQNCGMTEEEHLIIFGKFLTIHHIDYDKNNNSISNLLSLCFYCNSRVNYNRSYWMDHFRKKNQPIILK